MVSNNFTVLKFSETRSISELNTYNYDLDKQR